MMGTSEYQLLLASLRFACVVAHVVTSVNGGLVVLRCLASALLLERYRVRRRAISRQHLLDPRLRVWQVSKLMHLYERSWASVFDGLTG